MEDSEEEQVVLRQDGMEEGLDPQVVKEQEQ